MGEGSPRPGDEDLGVDCITTNDPALVRKLLGKRENQKIKVKLK